MDLPLEHYIKREIDEANKTTLEIARLTAENARLRTILADINQRASKLLDEIDKLRKLF